jgi:hypothetical protein
MFISPTILLDAAAAVVTGNPVFCPPEKNIAPTGIEVFGTFVGTVILEATIASQDEVNAATAVWQAITGSSWTAPALTSIATPWSHIRARVTAYTSGAISVRAI